MDTENDVPNDNEEDQSNFQEQNQSESKESVHEEPKEDEEAAMELPETAPQEEPTPESDTMAHTRTEDSKISMEMVKKMETRSSEAIKYDKSKDKFASLAKTALGSIIDIGRSSITGDVTEKKTARYMNTYKMDSDNPFNAEKVHKILKSVLEEALENLVYDPDKCPKQAKWASVAIRAKVKAMDFDRYKIICVVTIGEKHSQDVLATCRFLWDAEKDNYAACTLENTYVFAYAECFGLYYE